MRTPHTTPHRRLARQFYHFLRYTGYRRYESVGLMGPLTVTLLWASATGSTYDVLVYGSTPGGIIAAVAASRHGVGSVALLSQRANIGGMCSGGLGESDVGKCADEVIGGLALEFFHRSAASYATRQPRAPWNLEPHVAEATFRAMLAEANVTLLPFDEIGVVRTDGLEVRSITTVRDGATYDAAVFIDASYEGDLMARTEGVTWTWGRESTSTYNESRAGSKGGQSQYLTEFIDPLVHAPVGVGGAGGTVTPDLLPLVQPTAPALPDGTGDRQVQAYNFRLCVTNDATLRVPFAQPAGYDSARWELLRRFWRDVWPNSTNPHKYVRRAQRCTRLPHSNHSHSHELPFHTISRSTRQGRPGGSSVEDSRGDPLEQRRE